MKSLTFSLFLLSFMLLTLPATLNAQRGAIDCETAEIQAALRKSLQKVEKLGSIYGAVSPEVANEYYRLATFYCDKKCLRDAIRYHKKALGIREECLGPCHTDTVESYREIGNLYRLLGDLDNASRYHAKAMKATQKAFCEVWEKR